MRKLKRAKHLAQLHSMTDILYKAGL